MNRIRSLVQNSKIIKVWLISSVAILLIPVLFGYLFYQATSNTIQHEVETTNSTVIGQTYATIDNVVNELSKYCIGLTMNNNIKQLELAGSTLAPQDKYLPFEVSAHLKTDSSILSFAHNVYVYLPQLDMVISSGYVTSSHEFFSINYKAPTYNYDEWKNAITSTRGRRITVMDKRQTGNNPVQPVTILYPTSDIVTKSAYILAEFNIAEFFDSPTDLTRHALSSLYIFDQNDTMVYTNSDEIRNINFKGLTEERGQQEYNDFIISYVNSNLTGLKYVSLIEKQAYNQSIGTIRNLLFILLLLYLLAGGIAVAFLAKYNYQPIREIVAKIEALPEFQHQSEGRDEYKYINRAITEVFDKYNAAAEQLEGQTELMLDHLLHELLRGDFEDEDTKLSQLSACVKHPIAPSFCVIIIKIDNLTDFFKNEEMTAHQQSSLAFFLLKNVFCELCEKLGQGFIVSLESNMCAGIINLAGNPPALSDVQALAQELVEFFSSNFELKLTLAVSNLCSGAWAVSDAYQSALAALRYKICFPGQAVISCDALQRMNRSTLTYRYTTDTENKFVSCVKLGNYEDAAALLDGIFEENFDRTLYSLSVVRCFIFDIIGTILKTISELVDSNAHSMLMPDIERLMSMEDVSEIKLAMKELVKTVCDIMSSRSDSKLKGRVVKYVEENYADFNLSVGAVADGLSLNQSYISTAFREQSGEKLIDYINRIRVEKSLSYLTNKQLPLEKVAERVGYLNVRTYMRVFKKCYGITPSKYRDGQAIAPPPRMVNSNKFQHWLKSRLFPCRVSGMACGT